MKQRLVALAALSFAGAAAQAQEAAASPLTANLSLTTNYKFRGQDQSNKPAFFKPAIQGGFDYSMNGFYVGNWNSSIGWLDNSSIEMDFYGGYKGEIAPGFGYDVGILEYFYPGTHKADTTEIYAAVSFSFLSLKYSHNVNYKYFGIEDGRNTGYVDLSGNYEVVKGLTLNAHVGYTHFPGDAKDSAGVKSYVDYKLGGTYDLGSGFSAAAAYVGADKKGTYGDINKGRLVFTLTKTL